MNGWLGRVLTGLTLMALAASAAAADVPLVSDAWARATAPGVDVGAAYLTIQGGAASDRLVAASTPRASMVHLHTVEEQDGVAKMRPLEAVEVPAGARVELKPKGMHLMLMGLDQPLVAGESFTLTLRFAAAGDLAVTVTVRSASDGPAQHEQH